MDEVWNENIQYRNNQTKTGARRLSGRQRQFRLALGKTALYEHSRMAEYVFNQPRLAVVDRIASDLANISGKLMRVEEDGTEVEVTSHPFLDFMNHPNPLYEMTSSAIWRLHEIYLMLVGESFFPHRAG